MQGAGTAAHEAMQQRVFGLVDNTHPATAELLNDAVVRDGLADHLNPLPGSTRSLALILIGLPITWAAMAPSDYRAGSLAKQEAQSIYAADPHDSWNRIFYLLFTRPIKLRLTEDFGHEGSFVLVSIMGNPSFARHKPDLRAH